MVYVNAIYFVTTTATTIGYGDIHGQLESEKVFIILLEFVGICIFSTITGNIRRLKRSSNMQKIVQDRINKVKQFINEIDKVLKHKPLEDFIYDVTQSYIDQSYRFGVSKAFVGNQHYKVMSDKLKNRLVVQTVLKGYYDRFVFFFQDVVLNHQSDENFVRRILTNLDC